MAATNVFTIDAEVPPLRFESDGSIRVGQSRVVLAVLLNAYRDWGWSAEQLAEQFPTITLADAHGVLAHYLRHRKEVDAYLNDWNREASQAQQTWLTTPEGASIQAKLKVARLARVLT